jgi:hypothetical protein
MAKAASIMNELLIAETKELEKYIQGKVAEGEGSRAEERASCYFGHSHHLASEVRAGRLKPEKAAQYRYTSALCTAHHLTKIVRNHRICRIELDRLFADFRQREARNHE